MKPGDNCLLFEVGTEEIPAVMIDAAGCRLASLLEEALGRLGVSYLDPVRRFDSPRRLTVLLEGLPGKRPDLEETISGPPRSVAFDEQGAPTRAAQGFAAKLGVTVDELDLAQTQRGSYLSYTRRVEGRPLPELLPEILSEALRGLTWPKSMYWRQSRFRFIRPIRWLTALWNDEVLAFEFEGVTAGRTSRGHRFMGRPRVELDSACDYASQLEQAGVLVDPTRRKEAIEKEIAQALPEGLRVVEDPKLKAEVVYLNEFPSVICGSFEERYLKIPREVLITVMRHHQKYFAVSDVDGTLSAHFLTVLNTAGDDGRIREGHEKVLRARLDDASFFWDQDRKRPLQERVTALDKVLFQDKLGSYGDKTRRLELFCAHLAESWPGIDAQLLAQAAHLCKTDLTTDMVGELPELQGVMGGLYASDQGCPEEVRLAIGQHYQPVALDDPVPGTLYGALLSLADRFDTLVGCFGIGIVPTGSRDPFALRRQAQGCIKILFELGRDVPSEWTLSRWTEAALSFLQPERAPRETLADVREFLAGRVRYVYEGMGLASDVLDAVMAVGVEHVRDGYERAVALQQVRRQPDFEPLAVSFKRIRNILSKQGEELPEVDAGLFETQSERVLHDAFRQLAPVVASAVREGAYEKALGQLADLRGPVDAFFEEVLVMAEDRALRQNRLRLLQDLSELFLRIADISRIAAEKNTT